MPRRRFRAHVGFRKLLPEGRQQVRAVRDRWRMPSAARCRSLRTLRKLRPEHESHASAAGRSLPQRRPAVLANMRAPQASARAKHCMHVRRAFHRRFGPGRLDVADVGGPQLRPAKARSSPPLVARPSQAAPRSLNRQGCEIPRRTVRQLLLPPAKVPPAARLRIDLPNE